MANKIRQQNKSDWVHEFINYLRRRKKKKPTKNNPLNV
jgi:hypothetical protein